MKTRRSVRERQGNFLVDINTPLALRVNFSKYNSFSSRILLLLIVLSNQTLTVANLPYVILHIIDTLLHRSGELQRETGTLLHLTLSSFRVHPPFYAISF